MRSSDQRRRGESARVAGLLDREARDDAAVFGDQRRTVGRRLVDWPYCASGLWSSQIAIAQIRGRQWAMPAGVDVFDRAVAAQKRRFRPRGR